MPEHAVVRAAVEAVRRGYTPVPLHSRGKLPGLPTWTRLSFSPNDLPGVASSFEEYVAKGLDNLGLLLGEGGGNLVDVDIDHPRVLRLKDFFLPPTAMRSGRVTRPGTHYWYVVDGWLPATRRHKIPDDEGRGIVSVELRSTRAQTVIPPSVHPEGDEYTWQGSPWGGEEGPARVSGRLLATQVALLALGTVLLDAWPKRGGRHDAYLALAGALLRHGRGVHPWWERNLPILIGALAEVTRDDDGPETRVAEVMGTTISRLHRGSEKVTGYGVLSDILGAAHVQQARLLAAEVAELAGWTDGAKPREQERGSAAPAAAPASRVETRPKKDKRKRKDASDDEVQAEEAVPRLATELPPTWGELSLEPYISGEIVIQQPTVLPRTDGASLIYSGRVNMLYGSSETAKSWIALYACMEELARGNRVVYVDLEDEPAETLHRLRLMGAGDDDIRSNFHYVQPEEALAPLQVTAFGQDRATVRGRKNDDMFHELLDEVDPTMIVVDGMTELYGLHGHDTNAATATSLIGRWLKNLCRNGRTTVLCIDHTPKQSERGTLPTGSGYKKGLVQGTLLQVWAVDQPTEGQLGKLEIFVIKDRPGRVRKHSKKSTARVYLAAVVEHDSREPGQVTITISPPPTSDPISSSIARVDLTESRRAERATAEAEDRRRLWDFVVGLFEGDLDNVLWHKDIKNACHRHPRSWSEARVDEMLSRLCGEAAGGPVTERVLERVYQSRGRGKPAIHYRLTVGGV